MTGQKHRRHKPHHFGRVDPNKESSSGLAIGVAICVGVGLIVLIGECSTPHETSAVQAAKAAPEAIATAIATDAIPPVEALDVAAVRKGHDHLRLASKEGLAGEMIYSQNCYDALTHHFDWAKLDVCGSFDVSAAQTLDGDDAAGSDAELAWFDSEAAAGRYLKAATAAGEDADEADRRLDRLKEYVGKWRPAAASTSTIEPNAPTSGQASASEDSTAADGSMEGE
jgi:hypothetical protein